VSGRDQGALKVAEHLLPLWRTGRDIITDTRGIATLMQPTPRHPSPDSVEKLFSCCVPIEKSRNANKPMHPLVVFKWGGITSFPAYVTQVNAKYTRG